MAIQELKACGQWFEDLEREKRQMSKDNDNFKNQLEALETEKAMFKKELEGALEEHENKLYTAPLPPVAEINVEQ